MSSPAALLWTVAVVIAVRGDTGSEASLATGCTQALELLRTIVAPAGHQLSSLAVGPNGAILAISEGAGEAWYAAPGSSNFSPILLPDGSTPMAARLTNETVEIVDRNGHLMMGRIDGPLTRNVATPARQLRDAVYAGSWVGLAESGFGGPPPELFFLNETGSAAECTAPAIRAAVEGLLPLSIAPASRPGRILLAAQEPPHAVHEVDLLDCDARDLFERKSAVPPGRSHQHTIAFAPVWTGVDYLQTVSETVGDIRVVRRFSEAGDLLNETMIEAAIVFVAANPEKRLIAAVLSHNHTEILVYRMTSAPAP